MSSPTTAATPARFTFHACLGAGGFGEVYRATAQLRDGSEEVVAVKVLHVERQRQRAAVDRLRDEARMLAVLKHPAILKFQDFTRIDDRLALVTEYVEGTDISAFESAEASMPLKAELEVIAQVASALLCALRTPSPETGRPLGLVHRDVKPQNIRISRRGEVRLLDFGIARTTELSRDAQTWIGEVLCTPGYASPELLCGDPSGHASDIYALGVTLFSLVAHAPFHTSNTIPRQRKVALLRDRYGEYLAERMALLTDLPEALVELLERMLAYDLEARPDAAEVERVLLEIAETLDGPGLKAWSLRLPPQKGGEGELCGQTIAATPISVEPTVVPVATRQAPPTVPAGLEYSVPGRSTPPPPARGDAGPPDTSTPAAPVEDRAAPGPDPRLLVGVGLVVVVVLVALGWIWLG